nr:uncharacterized protein LOC112728735 isoform X1 [Arachis hypogaea]
MSRLMQSIFLRTIRRTVIQYENGEYYDGNEGAFPVPGILVALPCKVELLDQSSHVQEHLMNLIETPLYINHCVMPLFNLLDCVHDCCSPLFLNFFLQQSLTFPPHIFQHYNNQIMKQFSFELPNNDYIDQLASSTNKQQQFLDKQFTIFPEDCKISGMCRISLHGSILWTLLSLCTSNFGLYFISNLKSQIYISIY